MAQEGRQATLRVGCWAPTLLASHRRRQRPPLLHAFAEALAETLTLPLKPRQVWSWHTALGTTAERPCSRVRNLPLTSLRPGLRPLRHPGVERPLGRQGGAQTGQQSDDQEVLHAKRQLASGDCAAAPSRNATASKRSLNGLDAGLPTTINGRPVLGRDQAQVTRPRTLASCRPAPGTRTRKPCW